MPDTHNRVLASRITFYLHRFACRHMLMWSEQTKPSLWHLSRTTCCKSQPAMQLPANPQCAHIPGAMSAAASPTTFLAVMFSSLGLATLYISCPSVCFALCYIISIAIVKLQNHQGITQRGKLPCSGCLRESFLFIEFSIR